MFPQCFSATTEYCCQRQTLVWFCLGFQLKDDLKQYSRSVFSMPLLRWYFYCFSTSQNTTCSLSVGKEALSFTLCIHGKSSFPDQGRYSHLSSYLVFLCQNSITTVFTDNVDNVQGLRWGWCFFSPSSRVADASSRCSLRGPGNHYRTNSWTCANDSWSSISRA